MDQEIQYQPKYDEIDLMDLLIIIMKSWKLIAALFLITVLLVGSVTFFWIPKKYQSHTLFYLEAEGDYGSTFGKANMVKDVILTNYFLGGMMEKRGLGTTQAEIEQLRGAMAITQTEAQNLKLELIWDDPQLAYDLLYSVYNSYKDEVASRLRIYTTSKLEVAEEQFARSKKLFEQTNTELAAFQERSGIIFLPEQLAITDQYYQDLKKRLGVSPKYIREYEQLLTQHAAVKANYTKAYEIMEDTRRLVEKEQKYLFVIIEPPVFPEYKHAPSTVKNTTVAGVLALFVGAMLAFLREYMHKSKEREQAANTGKGC
jgi:capsular polysaccharide biosynthesis protein